MMKISHFVSKAHQIDKITLRSRSIALTPPEFEHAEEELRVFQENINHALKFLRKVKLHPNFFLHKKAPLFLVIGAGHAGKSSLLTQSGLNLIDAHNQAISNPMSTRYCQFWFSEKAVLVDTAGHYTTASSEDLSVNLAWRGLIKIIDKYKKRAPLSGIVVAIDLPTLSHNKELLTRVLGNIKERIYEIAKYAKNLPIFVVLTKMDLINGFTDFFADLDSEERKQPFGISFQNTISTSRPIQVFEKKFSALLKNLSDRAFLRISSEPLLDKRYQIQDFPLQIEALGNTIAEIINEIPHNAQTKLHGIYFTSSLQRGLPMDYLETPFLGTTISKPETTPKPTFTGLREQPYFLAGLFQEMLNSIAPTLEVNRKIIFTLPTLKPLYKPAGIALGAIILISIFLYYNFTTSTTMLTNLKEIAKAQYDILASSNDPESQLKRSYHLWQNTQEIFNKSHWWQFSVNDNTRKLSKIISKSYQDELATVFMPHIESILETTLSNAEHQKQEKAIYTTFKVYLMLTKSIPLDQNYVEQWFTNYFANNAGAKEKFLEQKKYLQDALALGLTISVNKEIKAAAYETLNELPIEKLIYSAFSAQEDIAHSSKLTLRSGGSLLDTSNFAIPTLYTISTLHGIGKQLTKAIDSFFIHDPVLGTNKLSQTSTDEILRKVNSVYLDAYATTWNEALKSIKVKEFSDFNNASAQLKALAAKSSPLFKLLKMIQDNANSSAGKLFSDWQNVDAKNLHSALLDLAEYFNSISNSVTGGQAVWQEAKNIMQSGKMPKEIEAVKSLANEEPEPLKSWLNALAFNSWKVLLTGTGVYLNNVWKEQVFPKINTLTNHYPLSKSANSEISFADFTNFFGHNGIFENFANKFLSPFIDKSKSYWAWKNFAGAKISISDDALEMFIRASLIQKMFYPNNATSPTSHFSLKPLEMNPNVRSFTLSLDGQIVFATAGKIRGYQLSWPGSKPSTTAVDFIDIQGKNLQATYSGPWGWFRLLDQANLQGTSNSRHYIVTFKLNDSSIKYELIADKPANPYVADVLDGFKCVERL